MTRTIKNRSTNHEKKQKIEQKIEFLEIASAKEMREMTKPCPERERTALAAMIRSH